MFESLAVLSVNLEVSMARLETIALRILFLMYVADTGMSHMSASFLGLGILLNYTVPF